MPRAAVSRADTDCSHVSAASAAAAVAICAEREREQQQPPRRRRHGRQPRPRESHAIQINYRLSFILDTHFILSTKCPIAEMPIFDDGAEASTLAGNLGMRTRGTENE
jgi:hypothetical protein